MKENIADKAQALKTKVEAEMTQKEQEEALTRTDKLKEKIKSEKEIKETFNKNFADVSQKKSEIETLLREGKEERKVLQTEGKNVVQDLRADEAGKAVLENEDYRSEIFGETINKLKEINESTKLYRTELKTLLEDLKKDSGNYTKDKQERVDAFLIEHPDIKNLQETASQYEKQLEYLKERENKLNDFMDYPEVFDHLDDKIIFENYKVVDLTLKSQFEKREKDLYETRARFSQEQKEVKEMKKGFFESTNSFNKKQDQLMEDIKQKEKTAEGEFFGGQGNFAEIRKIKEKIEENLYSFSNGFMYDREELVAKSKNIRGLVEIHRKELEEERKKYSLSEEEQLLLELNRELWS